MKRWTICVVRQPILFIHTNKQGNNLMHSAIEILVKRRYNFQMTINLWLINCGLQYQKQIEEESVFSREFNREEGARVQQQD